ncbi:heterokaryon incompatibility [Zopfia rhizophila CBS 207.26]|uniref:Heterokaryon incompatibility n=1 Tax=Zopfia rhizophila CBS 207.26 TaxID=1314779 RepID=A0A6A6E3P3_9PEZI|nr:heterokaryon incompatibility [Zopfia rhizophila CBS 207.26]
MLGQTYLWIDSLCIVQDDIRNWRPEGSKMADTYENAFLTISATASSDSSVGILWRSQG